MNLTQLKAEAEKAKTSTVELDPWRDGLEPDLVLRLVEVARAAVRAYAVLDLVEPNHSLTAELAGALEGIEP